VAPAVIADPGAVATTEVPAVTPAHYPSTMLQPPRRSARRRLRDWASEALGDVAYIVGLWILSAVAMLACLALLALAINAGLI
jgi:hypothetical protein